RSRRSGQNPAACAGCSGEKPEPRREDHHALHDGVVGSLSEHRRARRQGRLGCRSDLHLASAPRRTQSRRDRRRGSGNRIQGVARVRSIISEEGTLGRWAGAGRDCDARRIPVQRSRPRSRPCRSEAFCGKLGWQTFDPQRYRPHRRLAEGRLGRRRATARKPFIFSVRAGANNHSGAGGLINHIDVSSMLRKSVCELYSNLVTRPTGAAVRCEIEQELDRIGDRALTVIDFSHVGLLDFSCADEIVAKLLLQYVSTDAPRREVYFVVPGISESHMEAIEAVLERHKLALVTQHADGGTRLLGIIGLEERRAWEIISQLGAGAVADVAEATGLSRDAAERMLDTLWRRRLLIRYDDGYVAVGSATRSEPMRLDA